MNDDYYQYVFSRLLQIPVVLFFVSVIVFFMIHLTPGDPVLNMLGPYATDATIATMREQYNINEPLITQYLLWISKIFSGSLGTSITTSQPVLTMIVARLPVTLTLALSSLFVSALVAFPAGYISATNRLEWKDHLATVLAFLGLSIPNFFLAILLIKIFGVDLNILPISAHENLFQDYVLTLKTFILPAIALGTALAAQTTRLLRSSMIDVFHEEYVRVARSKGLPEKFINQSIVLKNALIPVLTIMGVQLGFLLGGTVIIEEVFALPGLGRLFFRMIEARDFPVIQGIILFYATFFLIINLLTDLLYGYIDPRIKYGSDVE